MRAPPDALMLELGAGGELLVAQLRAGLSLLILLLPLIHLLGGGRTGEAMVGFAAAIFIVVVAQAWLVLARQRRRHRWLPFATAAFDVTATTLVLLALALDSPARGLNSMVVWAFYLLAICMTALRNDGRLTLLTGLLAVLQYGLLVAWVFARHDGDALASPDHGTVTLPNQLQRLVLLALVTGITAAIVHRMQRLVDLSGTDGLTGLPNRTWLMHRFPAMVDAARDGGSLSICLVDLDYFKRINDEIGHHAGDRALRHVVEVLRGELDEQDWLARL